MKLQLLWVLAVSPGQTQEDLRGDLRALTLQLQDFEQQVFDFEADRTEETPVHCDPKDCQIVADPEFGQLEKWRVLPRASFHNPMHLLARPRTSDARMFDKVFKSWLYDDAITLAQHRMKKPQQWRPAFIVDAGGNAGYSAVYFARRFVTAQVYTVEPETQNLHLLRRNVHDLPNVQVVEAALWNRDTTVQFASGERSFAKDSYIVKDDQHAQRGRLPNAHATTMDHLCQMRCQLAGYGNECPPSCDKMVIDLVKVDIEGAEETVFKSNFNWLHRTNVLIVFLHGREEFHGRTNNPKSNSFWKAMHECGYPKEWEHIEKETSGHLHHVLVRKKMLSWVR